MGPFFRSLFQSAADFFSPPLASGAEVPRRLKPAPYMKALLTVNDFFYLTPPIGWRIFAFFDTLLLT